MFKKGLAGVFMLLLSNIAFADECASWGCISTIYEIIITGDDAIRIGTPLDESAANCTAPSGQFFTLNPQAPNAEQIYSAVLSAYISNKKIQLRIKEGSADCELSYVRFKADF